MNEPNPNSLELRGRELFEASVENVDMRIRSRLNQARHAALDAAARPRPRFLRLPIWTSAAGVTAAGVLGIAIWFGSPLMHHGPQIAENQSNFEDLEIVASRTRRRAMRWRCCRTISNFTIGQQRSPRHRIPAASVELSLRLRVFWWVITSAVSAVSTAGVGSAPPPPPPRRRRRPMNPSSNSWARTTWETQLGGNF